ncbi:MAG: S4 domain-containing protein, partial [Cyclobacteriaceae bacterium]|nr:S4 domain-containing protein [Cyclobacteriaceae bacterium]
MNEESIQSDDTEEELLFEHHRFVADPGQGLIRIDKFLNTRMGNVSRTKIQKGIDDGFVLVNDKAVKSNYKVHPNDVIVISLPESPRDTEIVPENIKLNIVYEDDTLLVINKPAGMVVHPAYQNWTGTVV